MTVTVTDLAIQTSTKSLASFINAEGDVAGILYFGNGSSHAFLYTGSMGVTDLGTFGGDTSYPGGLNAFGDVSGTAYGTNLNNPQGFYYHNGASSIVNIGGLTGTITNGNGINDSGTIVGSASLLNGSGQNSGSHAILSSNPHTTSPTDLYLQGVTLGGSVGEADFINNNGQIAGISNLPGDSTKQAFYSANGNSAVALTLGGNNSTAKGINANGLVIGYSAYTGGGNLQHGFVYDPATSTIVNLGTLNAQGGQNPYTGNSQALAINNSGQVVGFSEVATNTKNAFVCTLVTTPVETCSLIPLGTLGFTNSVANAINSSGEIVGTLSTGFTSDAFLYVDGQMYDLNNLLPADSPFKSLNTAVGINDAGQIIGQGTTKAGLQDAYVMTISGAISATPEPGSSVYMAIGLILTAAFARTIVRPKSSSRS